MSGRVLIAVTHLLGIGHLVRARHLAGALAQAGYEVVLASGGMPDGRAANGYRFVQLPPQDESDEAEQATEDERNTPSPSKQRRFIEHAIDSARHQ